MPVESEVSVEGTPSASSDSDDAAVWFPRDPILFEHPGGERRSECTADVILAFAPVEAEWSELPS